MKKSAICRRRKALAGLFFLSVFAAAPAWAGVITSDRDPNGSEGDAVSDSSISISSGYSIPTKNQGFEETGLGIVGSADHDLFLLTHFIQSDASSVLGQDFPNGQLQRANMRGHRFISIGARCSKVLPVIFQATLTPIPETGALFPVLGLIAAVAITQILRRRRIAHLRSGSPGAR